MSRIIKNWLYHRYGIDVYNPNPDGSDYHLANEIDRNWVKIVIRMPGKAIRKLAGALFHMPR